MTDRSSLSPLELRLISQIERLTGDQRQRLRELESRIEVLEREREAMKPMLGFFDSLAVSTDMSRD